VSPERKEDRTEDHIRLGLIGAGPWGRRYIETIGRLDGVRLTRLASRNPESPQLVGDACAIDTDWRATVAADDIDGIIIATPPALHCEMARAAVEAGLPVLVEKPLTLGSAEAESLLAAAVAADGLVMVDHIHLYSPAYRRLKELAGDMGAIREIRGENGDRGPFRPDTPVLWDWGSHDVALCLDLAGQVPERITARRLEHRQGQKNGGETIALTLGFADGLEASITLGNLFESRRRSLEVHFDGGVLTYDDTAADKLTRRKPSSAEAQAVAVDGTPPLDRVIGAFARAIEQGAPDLSGLRLGAEVVSVLEQAARSLEQGPG
jgi:predicted dehydrogenase